MSVSFDVPGGRVSGAWHEPAADARALLLLAHGAGSDYRTPALVALGDALADRGIATMRFNFLYSEAGKRAPDRAPKAIETYAAVATAVRDERPGAALVLGGRSFGCRMASHLAADGFACDGLVLLAYPLHPPGKPERLRAEHLPSIGVPTLVVQGTGDPFATPHLLDAAIASMTSATLVRIDGADHSFKVRGRTLADVTTEIATAIFRFTESLGRPATPRRRRAAPPSPASGRLT